MKKIKLHIVIFLIIAIIAFISLARDLWFQSIAFNPADYNLPATAREMVHLRTEKTVTFHLQGRHYVTIGRSPDMEDGGPVEPEDGTGSSL